MPIQTDELNAKLYSQNALADIIDLEGDFGRHYNLPNGWAVSVIRNQISYGGKQGQFELCLFDPSDRLIDDTVIGWLSPHHVSDYIELAFNGQVLYQRDNPF